MEARAALELRTKKETQSEEGIQEQADLVAEDNDWEEDGGDSSGVLSVKSTLISLDYLTKHVIIQDQPMRCTTGRENANEPKRIPLRALTAANQVYQWGRVFTCSPYQSLCQSLRQIPAV